MLNHLSRLTLIGMLLVCQSCATSKLWEDTNPNARIWIDADKTTEAALKQKGVDYQTYEGVRGKGYLIRKSGWEQMQDYHLRMLGTPITLVVDGAATVVVVGVYMLISDPAGTCALIELIADGGKGHPGHHGYRR